VEVIDIITRALGIAGGIIAIYLFFENKRLTIFHVDKELILLDVQQEELLKNIEKEKKKGIEGFASRGTYHSGLRVQFEKEMEEKRTKELRKIEACREYLQKMKKLPFSWMKKRN